MRSARLGAREGPRAGWGGVAPQDGRPSEPGAQPAVRRVHVLLQVTQDG
ncbi:hypothetical protein HMPREF9413_0724 [Paenibacillus sp. HGF7]|nr:hypothetical protein HMPREF9413_0724 [Paenibacillus sp. HGF7]